MADEVDEFLFRRFIPEENRGGTYHVTLRIGGQLVGPMTPQKANTMGWPLPQILSNINTQAIAERDANGQAAVTANAQRDAIKIERDNYKSQRDAKDSELQVALLRIAELEAQQNSITVALDAVGIDPAALKSVKLQSKVDVKTPGT